jgi:hypothetical protein
MAFLTYIECEVLNVVRHRPGDIGEHLRGGVVHDLAAGGGPLDQIRLHLRCRDRGERHPLRHAVQRGRLAHHQALHEMAA